MLTELSRITDLEYFIRSKSRSELFNKLQCMHHEMVLPFTDRSALEYDLQVNNYILSNSVLEVPYGKI